MNKYRSNKTPNPYARKIPLPCRLNAQEMHIVLGLAIKHTGGNVSEFVRCKLLGYPFPKMGKEK